MFFDEITIRRLNRTYHLRRRYTIRDSILYEREFSPESVLRTCASDPFIMSRMRSFLYASHEFQISRMSDSEVVRTVLYLLGARRAELVRERTFRGIHSLHFNGRELKWIDDGRQVVASWPAVSGREGYQAKEYQNVAEKGPLPEGRWHVKQSEYQEISVEDAVVGFASIVGWKMGAWPGSVIAWGAHRLWLHPSEKTNTFGRTNFSIHGGWKAGSAGCIDMTSYVQEFASAFRRYGKDMELTVAYG